jgi:hypothetical protein
MKHPGIIFICAVILQPQLLLAAQSTNAVAGKVIFSAGNNTAIGPGGQQRAIKQGDEVRSGDKLQTDKGQLQVRFTDNGFVSLKPKSQLVINDYSFGGKEDGTEKAFFSLLKGSVRAVTGLIGKNNNKAYKYDTPVATIGIRGTAFVLNFCNQDCFGADGSLLPDGLYVNNGEGRVYVESNGGMIDLIRGQFAFVQDADTRPEQIEQPPALQDMFREETEDYDFDFRSTENLIEEIREDHSIIDGGLGEIQGLAFTVLGNDTGFMGKQFTSAEDPSNRVYADDSGAIPYFYFFDTGSGHMLHFDSLDARPIEERTGFNPIVDASWGIWEGNFHYFDDDAGTLLINNPVYMAYMGFSNPTALNRLPTGGTAVYDVQMDPRANGAVNVMTGALSENFTARIDVNWEMAQFTRFELDARFTDGTRFDMGISGPQTISPSGVSFSGNYDDDMGSTGIFGGANFQFAQDAQMIGGSFHAVDDGGNPITVGTYLLGQKDGIFEDLPLPDIIQ